MKTKTNAAAKDDLKFYMRSGLESTTAEIKKSKDGPKLYKRNGIEVYCSDWCGGGTACCKLSDYNRAVANANKLAKRLGLGWEPRVWENLGWHYEAVFGATGEVTIKEDRRANYRAWQSPHVSKTCETPTDALLDLLATVQACRAAYVAREAELIRALKVANSGKLTRSKRR